MRHDKTAQQYQSHVEGWRANVPLFRAIATSGSIILSVIWLTWQGSGWVSEIRNEVRELRTAITSVTRSLDDKAGVKDVEHRFALQCARAPAQYKPWVCDQTSFAAAAPKTENRK